MPLSRLDCSMVVSPSSIIRDGQNIGTEKPVVHPLLKLAASGTIFFVMCEERRCISLLFCVEREMM